MDAEGLSELTRLLEQGEFPNTHAVLIEHAGALIYEAYFEGDDYQGDAELTRVKFDAHTLHDIRSITKSVTALLLGLALEEEFEPALKTPIVEFFPDLRDRVGAGVERITLLQVLTMTAGLDWDERTHPWGSPENDEFLLHTTDRPIELVLARSVTAEPGTNWTYNSGMTELAGGIIERKTGKNVRDFARSVLFGPLGVEEFEWWGAKTWLPAGMPAASGGLRLRARDLAKIGSLVLHKGRWGGQQVVPTEVIELIVQPHVDRIGQVANGILGYGLQWYAGKSTSIPSFPLIGAFGNGGQRLFILPKQHLVITVLAGNYNGPYQDNGERMIGRIARAHYGHE
ncbi:MAG: serine hydrolase [Pseudomonadota bacterium]